MHDASERLDISTHLTCLRPQCLRAAQDLDACPHPVIGRTQVGEVIMTKSHGQKQPTCRAREIRCLFEKPLRLFTAKPGPLLVDNLNDHREHRRHSFEARMQQRRTEASGCSKPGASSFEVGGDNPAARFANSRGS
jgi:hypothetical protein